VGIARGSLTIGHLPILSVQSLRLESHTASGGINGQKEEAQKEAKEAIED
jgi:hypothetical protein